MRVRLRSPAGVSTLNLADDATVSDLLSNISQSTSLPLFDLKWGYPPQPVDPSLYGLSTKLSDTDLKLNGEQLIVIAKETGDQSAQLSQDTSASATSSQSTSFSGQPSSGKNDQPLSLSRKPTTVESDPPEIPFPSRAATVVLRVMPDDNSCLFRALGTALLTGDLDSMTELRSIVAQGIQADPERYSEAVLEKPPDKYCEWIQNPNSWGGAVEIGIIAQHFGVEVCSINVQDVRVDRFNEPQRGEPKRSRIILVYSGIHYDTIALSPSSPPHTRADMDAEFDLKQFEGDDDEVVQAARELCKELQKRHYYTDTQKFSIKCNVCGWKGNGERSAVEHAQATSHMDFGEAG